MISLIEFAEFGKKDGPSIKDAFQKEAYEGQEKIIQYLEKEEFIKIVSTKVGIDINTKEEVVIPYYFYNDGEYSWNSMIPYYVKKYNLRLPKNFEDKILQKSNME